MKQNKWSSAGQATCIKWRAWYFVRWCHAIKNPSHKFTVNVWTHTGSILITLKTPPITYNTHRKLTAGAERKVSNSSCRNCLFLCKHMIIWSYLFRILLTACLCFLVALHFYERYISLFSREFWLTSYLKRSHASEKHHVYTNRSDFHSLYCKLDFVAFQLIWGFVCFFIKQC